MLFSGLKKWENFFNHDVLKKRLLFVIIEIEIKLLIVKNNKD